MKDLSILFGFPDLKLYMDRVETALSAAANRAPDQLAQACERQISAGGKRLRPALAIDIATAFGGGDEAKVVDAAAALELVHTGSLIHDDIIDRADHRRKKPTINAIEGADLAIIAGDLLLGVAGELATSVSQDVGRALSTAIVSLCVGQTQEMLATRQIDRSRESYEISIYGKTAALVEAACTIGGLCAGRSADDVAALGEFGRSFGLAFQIVDDVLDVLADEDKWGKPIGADLTAGVLTLPGIIAREQGDDAVLGAIERAWQGDPSVESQRSALEALRTSPHLEASLDEARHHVAVAEAALARFASMQRFATLQALPGTYVVDQVTEMT